MIVKGASGKKHAPVHGTLAEESRQAYADSRMSKELHGNAQDASKIALPIMLHTAAFQVNARALRFAAQDSSDQDKPSVIQPFQLRRQLKRGTQFPTTSSSTVTHYSQ